MGESQAEYEITIEVESPFADLVDAAALEEAVAAALHFEGVQAASVAVVITDDESVRTLNREYRGVDSATDVLSFAAQEGDAPLHDMPAELRALLEAELGDIFIACPYAEAQAQRYGNTLSAELKLLAVHGVLHLLGYDHATPEDEVALWARQEEILTPLGVKGLSHRTYEE